MIYNFISKYTHLKINNQQPREFRRKKLFKLFSIGRMEKLSLFPDKFPNSWLYRKKPRIVIIVKNNSSAN